MTPEKLEEFALFIAQLSYQCGLHEGREAGDLVATIPEIEESKAVKVVRAAIGEDTDKFDVYIDCEYGGGHGFNFEEIEGYIGKEAVSRLAEKYYPEHEFKNSMQHEDFEYDTNHQRQITLAEFIKEICKLVKLD